MVPLDVVLVMEVASYLEGLSLATTLIPLST